MLKDVFVKHQEELEQHAGDFYRMVQAHGYAENTDPGYHQYYRWNGLKKNLFYYEHLDNRQLEDIFSKTVIFKKNISFILRLKIRDPLVKVPFREIAGVLADISFYEVSCMGWEAISTCGTFIFEFMDESEGLFVGNFDIPGYDKLINEQQVKWAG